ncbi:MAG: alkaline phosphatase family protein [Jatrophihabitans sp.]
MRTRAWVVGLTAALMVAGCTSAGPGASRSTDPHPSVSLHASSSPSISTDAHSNVSVAGHIVIVMMENHSYSDIIGARSAPYLNGLARSGASLTNMHAVTHPSEPNYLALFTGSTHEVAGDPCPLHLSGDNLAAQLRRAGRSFVGYSEGLPRTGSLACTAGSYARRHAPWTNFAALPASMNRPFSAFPSNYTQLPSVAIVVPDVDNDMHDGSIARGDAWVRRHLNGYATWARTHASLLVITWDEDDRSEGNRVPTIVVGAGVRSQRIAHEATLYSLLRLVEGRLHLAYLGGARSASAISLQ